MTTIRGRIWQHRIDVTTVGDPHPTYIGGHWCWQVLDHRLEPTLRIRHANSATTWRDALDACLHAIEALKRRAAPYT